MLNLSFHREEIRSSVISSQIPSPLPEREVITLEFKISKVCINVMLNN